MKRISLVLLVGITIIICSVYFFNKRQVKSESVCDKILERVNISPVKVYNGTPAPVKFSKFPEAKLFYTRITEEAKNGPNFAGHFTFAHWGCGTLCFQYAIVDSITGDIVDYHDSPVELVIDTTYDVNSRLLVFNPKREFERNNGKRLEEIFKNDEFEASWDREYYEFVENDAVYSPWLNKLCSENVLDGLYKF